MARASIDYAERSGFHVETLSAGKSNSVPRISEFATPNQLREEARWAMQLHRFSSVVPNQRGWFSILIECLNARGLMLPLDADVDNLWEVSR